MCVCRTEIQIHRVSERGYGVYKSSNTRVMVDPGALHVQLFSELRCVCVRVCVRVRVHLLTTSSVSVGPLQRLGCRTVTDAPECQLASSVKTKRVMRKRCRKERRREEKCAGRSEDKTQTHTSLRLKFPFLTMLICFICPPAPKPKRKDNITHL